MTLKNLLLLLILITLLAGCGAPLGPAPTTAPANDGPSEAALAETMTALVATASAVPEPSAADPTLAAPTSPAPASPTAPAHSPWVALTGMDRNIWLVNSATSDMRQITLDATPGEPGSGQNTIDYSNPRWSSDGKFLAFTRQTSEPVVGGLHFEYSLWIYNLETGQERAVLGNAATAGYDWQPGTHLLTYSPTLDMNYFATRGTVNAALASGIWAFDADNPSEPFELIKPENGRALVWPEWSPDGSKIAFDEVVLHEGRGLFAYYDLSAEKYTALEQQVGSYDWSPDSKTIVFDLQTYMPNGSERIRFLDLGEQRERALQPENEQGFTISPAFSPDGQQIAYVIGLNGMDSTTYQLVVQPAAGGEPRVLGVFEYLEGLDWSPDGAYLVFSSGSYERRQVVAVQAADGTIRVLAPGWQSAWQPGLLPGAE